MTEHDGWTNEETWLVDNCLGDSFKEAAKRGEDITADFIRQEVALETDALRDTDSLVEDLLHLTMGNAYRETLNKALELVDYAQLADAYAWWRGEE